MEKPLYVSYYEISSETVHEYRGYIRFIPKGFQLYQSEGDPIDFKSVNKSSKNNEILEEKAVKSTILFYKDIVNVSYVRSGANRKLAEYVYVDFLGKKYCFRVIKTSTSSKTAYDLYKFFMLKTENLTAILKEQYAPKGAMSEYEQTREDTKLYIYKDGKFLQEALVSFDSYCLNVLYTRDLGYNDCTSMWYKSITSVKKYYMDNVKLYYDPCLKYDEKYNKRDRSSIEWHEKDYGSCTVIEFVYHQNTFFLFLKTDLAEKVYEYLKRVRRNKEVDLPQFLYYYV